MTKAEGYRIHMVNPVVDKDPLKIFESPGAMREILEEQGAVLGEAGGWYGVFASRQAVPEKDWESCHFLLFPGVSGDSRKFMTMDNIDLEILERGIGLAMKFLKKYPHSFVGLNHSSDDRGRRPQPMNLNDIHLHLIQLPQSAEPLGYYPGTTAEHPFGIVDEILSRRLGPLVEGGGFSMVSGTERKGLIYPIRGALVVKCSGGVLGDELAGFFLKLNQSYAKVHKQFFSMFVENYGKVRESGWKQPYRLYSAEEIRKNLGEAGIFDGKVLKYLQRVAGRLKEDDKVEPGDNKRLILRSPAYSVAMFLDGGELYTVFAPRLRAAAGPIEALGYVLDRKLEDGAPMEKRRELKKLLGRLVYYPPLIRLDKLPNLVYIRQDVYSKTARAGNQKKLI